MDTLVAVTALCARAGVAASRNVDARNVLARMRWRGYFMNGLRTKRMRVTSL
jgi:hypothetical protein